MTTWPIALRQASEQDLAVVVNLLDEASKWLRKLGTDQWARPWPDQRGRDSRIRHHLRARRTWIAWDGRIAAATITADPEPEPHWPEPEIHEPAIYLHRLVVSRSYAGTRLGSELINWAGLRARRDSGALWIRANAWTTNEGLRAYYLKEGFSPFGESVDDAYPAAAMFQKTTDQLTPAASLLFRVESDG